MASCKTSKISGLKTAALSMAALAFTSLSFTVALGTGIGSTPAMAEGLEEGQGQGQGQGQGGTQTGAKGLFFQQLEKPKESLNTGLRYWIEMKRNGVTQRVSNKTQFKAGDSIRFHVRSNIDGYAYILLSSGSRGEREVLFPDAKAGEKNKVAAGRDYVLPQDGAWTFDENPGTEKLTLLLSRNTIDPTAYLSKSSGEKELTLIASASDGAKDLVPARIYVAYSAPHADGPPPAVLAAANRKGSDSTDKTDKPVVKVATKKVEKKVEKKVVKVETKPVKVAHKANPEETPAATTSSSKRTAVAYDPSPSNDEGTTTVVSEKASGILHVDVDLQHI